MAVELSRLDLSLPAETTSTENVSPGGARVVSRRRWKAGDRVLVNGLKGDLQWQARVVYCETLSNNAFAIGLKLLTPAERWEKGTSDSVTPANKPTWKRPSKFRAPRVRGPLTPKRRVGYNAHTKPLSFVRLALHPDSGHLHKRKLLLRG